jgi:acetyl esterase/lipase
LIHTAEGDPLRGQGAAYAARLGRAGVRVTHRCHDGLTYLFDGIKAAIPCTAGAFRLMGGDIRAFL